MMNNTSNIDIINITIKNRRFLIGLEIEDF